MLDTPIWVAYATGLLATIAIFLRLHNRRKLNLPPGPKPWPIIGNLNLINSLPHIALHHLSQKYGPIMQLKFGSRPIVVASSVQMAKIILRDQDAIFAGRPSTAAGKYTNYNFKNMSTSPYGRYYCQARKICKMELFSVKRLDSFEYIRREEMKLFINTLFKLNGKPFSLKDYLSDNNLSMISRMALGKNYTVKRDGEEVAMNPVEFKRMLDEQLLLNGILEIGDSIPWLAFLDLQGNIKKMKALHRKVDGFLERILNEHEGRRKKKENYDVKDMVDVLLDLSNDPNLEIKLGRDSVKAFTMDMIVGGTETSALTLEWAFSELLKKPEIFEKTRRELDRIIGKERWVEENDIVNLPYIEAIAKEVMRLHPVAPLLVPRQTLQDTKVDDYDIPKGTRVYVNVWSIGRDPTIWDQPYEFRPERFIGSTIDIKGHDFELLPFGSGRRICPGYPLAIKVIQTSLANLLHGFNWKLADNMKKEDLSMDESSGASAPRKVPLLVVAEPCLPSYLYSI